MLTVDRDRLALCIIDYWKLWPVVTRWEEGDLDHHPSLFPPLLLNYYYYCVNYKATGVTSVQLSADCITVAIVYQTEVKH